MNRVLGPPYPAEAGLWGKPTNINNVKTWAAVPLIIHHGAEWYAGIGTEKSKGTMIFSVVGKINNTGLVEVPMGVSLRELIFDIGGGIPKGKAFKAAQIGGPSGGCLPAEHLDVPIDYESLSSPGRHRGLRRTGGRGRRHLHGGLRALLHEFHAGGIVREVRAMPHRDQGHAGHAGTHLRGERPARRHRLSAGTGRGGQEQLHCADWVRPRPTRC